MISAKIVVTVVIEVIELIVVIVAIEVIVVTVNVVKDVAVEANIKPIFQHNTFRHFMRYPQTITKTSSK